MGGGKKEKEKKMTWELTNRDRSWKEKKREKRIWELTKERRR